MPDTSVPLWTAPDIAMATGGRIEGGAFDAMGVTFNSQEAVPGDQRGRSIGFPTANIIVDPGTEPFRGIYAVRVRDGEVSGSASWSGAGYFGDRPTFETTRIFLEVHILDFDADIYGRTLAVEFIDFIRPDRKFNSVEDLQRQMLDDCARARSILEALRKHNPHTSYPLGLAQETGSI